MVRTRVGFIMAVICGAFLAGGCAKHEVVKAEEPMVPPAVAPRVKADTALGMKPMSAEQNVVLPKESIVKDEIAAPSSQAGELKAGLDKIYFNFNSAALSEEARNTLVKNADSIKKVGKATIRVEGNCDERGSDDYNLALGEQRAKEAVKYLVNLGIPATRFTVISYGKEKPAASGHDEASWVKNRRDEFIVVP